jgi:hypothetical protein
MPIGYLPMVNDYWYQPNTGILNRVPVVNAGPDIQVKLPLNKNSVIIRGSIRDDDLEQNPIPSQFSASWKQVGGKPVLFQPEMTYSRYLYSIKVINPPAGSYVFQLEAVDSKGNRSRQSMHLNVIA